jgi:hypothetical protein
MAKFKLEDGKEIEAFTADELKAAIENEVAGLKAKNGELLGLHAKEKERLAELEAAAQAAEVERQKEKGEFKTLYEKTQAELEGEREAARKFRTEVQTKTLESEAFKLATSMTSDTKRAELLKKEIQQYAKYTDNGVQFEVGGVAIEGSKLAEKLKTDYPFLADGSGASGGGASGANGIKPNINMTSTQKIAEGLKALNS